MKAIYPAKLIYENNGEYSVLFPDLKGCATYGDSLEHALSMAQEALGLYLVALEERDHSTPTASNLDAIKADKGEHIVPIMVEVNDYRQNKTVNKTLTLPAWLNEAGEKARVNFSGILQDALKQRLGY
ncbi:MAG: type II toxin-antitoxin system HicB family antitoxin [Defluviitaleaceae bacterium]|nr:type II toxin-antitoxin system HicB family antitoxin [Defluviitaleaceae bacterium]